MKKLLEPYDGKLSCTVLRRGRWRKFSSLFDFKNQIIDDMLETFDIKRSLSAKGTPLDNAVAE
ncbi:MAG: hypothetical protein FWG67_00015, partial [Defluviitaleaceae bacterium]|nr:hypothetical protein [Defluviitaleaceae bacterium]